MSVPLVLAGHSHVHCMGVPGQGADPAPRLVPIDAGGAPVEGVVGARTDAYWNALVEASSSRIPAVIWDGNQHYGYFLFAPQPSFDFVLSSAAKLPLDRSVQIVSETTVRAFIAPSLDPLVALLKRLTAASPFAPLVIGTPPPKGDVARVCANIASEPHFLQWAKKLGVAAIEDRLTPVPLMVKLWLLIQDMLRETAGANAAVFVPVPARLIGVGNVLSDEHWSGDVTHTNAAYGQEMLREVIDAASRGVTSIEERAA